MKRGIKKEMNALLHFNISYHRPIWLPCRTRGKCTSTGTALEVIDTTCRKSDPNLKC